MWILSIFWYFDRHNKNTFFHWNEFNDIFCSIFSHYVNFLFKENLFAWLYSCSYFDILKEVCKFIQQFIFILFGLYFKLFCWNILEQFNEHFFMIEYFSGIASFIIKFHCSDTSDVFIFFCFLTWILSYLYFINYFSK